MSLSRLHSFMTRVGSGALIGGCMNCVSMVCEILKLLGYSLDLFEIFFELEGHNT